MRKLTLTIGSGVIGLALLVGASQRATATDEATIPSDGVHCYYHLYHCTYDNDSYWSQCDPRFGEGWISTASARAVCRQYNHAS
jgi:hypothetical protein